ncbi:alpha/beta hydrolase [Streptomyces profundus]|uniref:alpha/beta hydrolase n=1 Tax=Streptomyces profundus TaxID=2867410 RepID=UPI001D16D396|nr:alpha/beta hydrolase [Streptomyces sp. MA3_2.13]UED86732.1 lysophospholipase [Streptomyces sp. MA3_2.13]
MTATPLSTSSTVHSWHEPAGIAPRGTLLLLAGRGETAQVYRRFGTRLAADAYRVVAVPTDPAGADAAEALAALIAEPDTPRPLVLVGVDSGGPHALRLAREHAEAVDAVILAGLPTRDTRPEEPEAEIAARTACPNHRLVLGREGAAGSPAGQPPVVDASPLGLPLLAVHGRADQISPPAEAAPLYRALGAASLVEVDGGLHDILNDVSHRSVAATVVLFLERLRNGAHLPPVVSELPDPGAQPATSR